MIPKITNKNAVLFCAIALAFAGCGYTTGSMLPPSMKTVAVEPFKNEIVYSADGGGRNLYLPLLEVKARNAIVDRFQVDGHLRIADADKANLLMKGKLIGYQRDALRYEDNEDVKEYRVRIIVALEMWNQSANTLEWKEDGFAGEATYFLTGAQATSEDSAIAEAVIDLARRVVERTIENW